MKLTNEGCLQEIDRCNLSVKRIGINNNGNAKLLIECKAPSIKVDKKVFDQTAIYNKQLNSEFLMITNGLSHLYFKCNNNSKSYTFIKDFPL